MLRNITTHPFYHIWQTHLYNRLNLLLRLSNYPPLSVNLKTRLIVVVEPHSEVIPIPDRCYCYVTKRSAHYTFIGQRPFVVQLYFNYTSIKS